MPADYLSTAQALAVSPATSPSQERIAAPWAQPRRPSRTRTTSTRRLVTSRFGREPGGAGSSSASGGVLARWSPVLARTARRLDGLARQLMAVYLALPLWQRAAVAAMGLASLCMGVVFLAYSHRIFAWLGPVAERWRAVPLGWTLIWIATFCTAFPPMIGYSTAVTIAGFVYGFPLGWPIVASANVAGSLAAFATSRTVFSGYVHRLVGQDHRFVALAQVLRREGLGMLTMIRFCPLPYSLSNGFLATIPSIRPWAFAASTALASPKLLVHVFIGSRLALLAEEGDSMSAGDKAINYLSMIVGGSVGLVVGVVIYNRTMERAKELAVEGFEDLDGEPAAPGASASADYADMEAGLLDPDAAAALMDDDDISLWEGDGFGDEDDGGGRGTGSGAGSTLVGSYTDEEQGMELNGSPASGVDGRAKDDGF